MALGKTDFMVLMVAVHLYLLVFALIPCCSEAIVRYRFPEGVKRRVALRGHLKKMKTTP